MVEPSDSPSAANEAAMPRWVKAQGFLVVLLVLIVVGMSTGLIHLGQNGVDDGHGPASGEPAAAAPPGASHRWP